MGISENLAHYWTISLQDSPAKLMSVTVEDNNLETQVDNNSTFENIMDDDALYEQSDSDDERWGSDPESDPESDPKSDSSELKRIRPATELQQVRTTVHRQFSPRRPVQTDSESDSESTSNKAVIRPTSRQSINPTTTTIRPTSRQQMTPTNLIGEITTSRQSINPTTTAIRPTSWQQITPTNLFGGITTMDESAPQTRDSS